MLDTKQAAIFCVQLNVAYRGWRKKYGMYDIKKIIPPAAAPELAVNIQV